MARNKKWLQVGSILTKDKPSQGNKPDRSKGYFFIFNKDEINSVVINGIELDLDDSPFLNVAKPMDKYDYLVDQGKMSEDEYDDKAAELENTRVTFQLTLPPAKT